jgi:hypothetical protein
MLIIYVVMALILLFRPQGLFGGPQRSRMVGLQRSWRSSRFPLSPQLPRQAPPGDLDWGIFAKSLDLLMGYAGMVSFGHSAFFRHRRPCRRAGPGQSPGLVPAPASASAAATRS